MNQTTLNISHLLPINREMAARIALCTSHFESTITLEHNNSMLNMKSMLGLLSQAFPKDGNVTVTADGSDENAAIEAMIALLKK